MKSVSKAVIAALVGGLRPFFALEKSDVGFIVRARKQQSSAGIVER